MELSGEVDELALLRFEKEALGIYISAHPMTSYPGLPEAASCQIAQVDDHYRELAQSEPGRVKVVLSGLIQNVVKRPTRKGSMMARFELADESGSREVVAFSRRYDEIAHLLEEDKPAVLVAEVSEDGEATRLVAERLIRWDLRGQGDEANTAPEVAVLRFDLDRVAQLQLLELRSLLDDLSGRTPVRLEVKSEDGRYLYQPDGVRVDAHLLDELRSACPWLRVGLTIDRQALLAKKASRPFGPREVPVEVPF